MKYSTSELSAYLDEALPVDAMAAIEMALRGDAGLIEQLAELSARRDAGVHSLGEIWRRHRLSCPSREQLGSHLLGVLSDEESDYITFHLVEIGCRYCTANVEDLKRQQAEVAERAAIRRHRYFQSSAGHLRAVKA
ncbi:MAG: hypothetical protein IT427_07310 [Pirellulales bacterium]|nr:hypothetical protein [Pirellulales bacterium]